VTAQEVSSKINVLQKLVTEVGSDQYLLKSIMDSVSAVIEKCNHKMVERNIAKKSKGQKFISNIAYTKPKASKGKPTISKTVFPGRGNFSQIGKGHDSSGGIVATAKKQSHPGTNRHKAKRDMKFCDDCGSYVTSKAMFLTECTLRFVADHAPQVWGNIKQKRKRTRILLS
jgi:hypothetical protein